jgi:hypothetical protein
MANPTPSITIQQEQIDAYEETARRFLREVFDMDFESCLLTDLSQLSDFAGTGLPPERASGAQSLAALYDAWDAWVTDTIQTRYRLEQVSPRIHLVELFARIEERAAQQVH